MSLLATAKANGQCPHAWQTDVLTRLPAPLNKNIGELLPHRWRPTTSGWGGQKLTLVRACDR